MVINLPQKVEFILNALQNNGYKAYIVGGCVRDSLLNITPKDWDITTSAKPEDVISIFDKTIPTGLQHGTVTVMIEREGFEVTTFRVDGEYKDNRKPKSVQFISDLMGDLERRDYTVNGIAYNHQEGLIDYFNGKEDLENGILKCIGTPTERFREDSLRILRGVRFAGKYEMCIDVDTYNSMAKNSHLLNNISKERIRDELCKILTVGFVEDSMEVMYLTGILKHILPDIHNMRGFNQNNPHHYLDLYQHTISVLSHTEPNLILRLSALLHDVGKIATYIIDDNGISHYPSHEKVGAQMAEIILRDLKFDNSTIESVTKVISDHMSKSQKVSDKAVKRFINRIGIENIDNCLKLMRADIIGHTPPHNMETMVNLENKIKEILENKEPLNVSELNITGKDLIKLGLKPSPLFSIILDDCLDLVMDSPKSNNVECLIEYITKKYLDKSTSSMI